MYLAQQGRKRKLTLGDGNCFFRAVSLVVHDTQDNHLKIRENLVTFVELNRHMFQKFVMTGTFEEHTITMRRQGAWGTQVELCAAASYYQLPFYVCSPHPADKQYRWLLFKSLNRAQLSFQGNSIPKTPGISHFELCHTSGNHFDCVVDKDNQIPNFPPQLQNMSSSISLV